MKTFGWIWLLSICWSCTPQEKTLHFDMEVFRQKAEKILNEIPGWEIKLVAERNEKETKRYVLEEVQMAEQTWNYHFSDNRRVLFYVDEMNYNSYVKANEVFEMLKKKSKGGDEIPGLTYTNDFLFVKGKSIFWLNTACMYSWTNHTLLVKAFKSCIDKEIGKDTISCRCGFECD